MFIKKATLKSFNSQNYTAIIQIAGSNTAYLAGIKVARNITSAEMLTGRTLGVLFFDKTNASDAVIIAVY
jgi:hypothetical protein